MAVGLPRIYGITDPVMEAVVFHGLGAVDPVPAIDADWRPSLPWLVSQRLAGVALAMVKDHGVELPRDMLVHLQAARRHERARTLLADLSAARVSTVMRSAGVPFVVVKGPAMAAVDPVPAARPYLDVDIVVPPNRFDDAMEAARSAGFESNTERPARKYYERHCYEGVNLRDGSQRAIDIHHHVPPWWAGRTLTYEYLARDARVGAIAGTDAPLASATSNLFIAALHLVSDHNLPGHKLLSWRDVMLTASLIDPVEVASAADQLGLAWWLHWIVTQMPRTEALDSLIAQLDRTASTSPPRVGAQRVKALCAAGERGQNLAFAARLPVSNAAAYIAGQVLPSRTSRAARLNGNESLLAWWKFAAGSFVRSKTTFEGK
jgi:hypothetical protein